MFDYEDDDTIEPGDFPARNAPLPDEPTRAIPGTADKLAVMMLRRSKNQSIFHPFDCRYEGDELPNEFMNKSESERAAVLDSIKVKTVVSLYFS